MQQNGIIIQLLNYFINEADIIVEEEEWST